MAVEWANSANKHGIDHEDALHAIENAVYVEQEFDEPRVPGYAKPWLFIGPPRTLGGPLLEVMVEIVPPRGMVVFHVMEAREKHLTRMRDRR
ncbi:hypothetical protein HYG77_35465 (plasmid) [Rhodococcus sp. ZPP]|uniref:hypothetical protein n=1 Tax=Rhodococcus sp. ZPP TaxID=2749906 RepID=UPI001AD86789|nr:hypothetical protein [Rhodococcus sp. ZPP]QTJ70751.1 hypothetical protein HYG77_35465 [Rhodococcus sp. ZPP]